MAITEDGTITPRFTLATSNGHNRAWHVANGCRNVIDFEECMAVIESANVCDSGMAGKQKC